tara:strand:- start:11634 stop:11885 length:252 start_codon:yes stop_codon:yes gene_type:complete
LHKNYNGIDIESCIPNPNKMENQNPHPVGAAVSSTISLLTALFAVLTIENVQMYLTMSASFIAIVSGGFAIRYYYHATNKIKK